MNEKELKIKLTKIKCYPSPKWKSQRRELLWAQIAGTTKQQTKARFFYGLKVILFGKNFKSFRLKPAWSVLLIIAIVLLGGTFSLRAARNSCPGEALYIAKRISEQTQLALTFNEKQRAKLGIEFASLRAEELNKVLAEEKSSDIKEKHVEQLTQDFKKQIIVAKNNLAKISKNQPSQKQNSKPNSAPAPKPPIVEQADSLSLKSNNSSNDNNNDNNNDNKIFSANLGKNNKRIEINSPSSQTDSNKPQASVNSLTTASTSKSVVSSTTNSQELAQTSLADVNKILAEAQQLIEKNDIAATVDKLDQANKIIEQIDDSIDAGQVKGASEPSGLKATTSEAAVEKGGNQATTSPKTKEASTTDSN